MADAKVTHRLTEFTFATDPTAHALNLVSTMLATLVSKRKEVEISSEITANEIIIRVKVDPSDMGKVVGKKGHTAQAMRLLLAAHSRRVGLQFRLDIDLPGAAERKAQ